VLMLAVPAAWALSRRHRGAPAPWAGFALIMAPFLIDVTGNTLDLYDSVAWWDNLNHLVNWFLLSAGIGVLLLRSGVRPRWALGGLVCGIGALLAIGGSSASGTPFSATARSVLRPMRTPSVRRRWAAWERPWRGWSSRATSPPEAPVAATLDPVAAPAPAHDSARRAPQVPLARTG